MINAEVTPCPPAPLSLPAVVPEFKDEANDNHADHARAGERRTFELPRIIWLGVIGCYAVFLAALLAATGTRRASFAIAVSAIYISMVFGTARAIGRQGPHQGASLIQQSGGVLQTVFGPMSRSAVFGQILVVPVAVAVFGVVVAVIIAVVAAWLTTRFRKARRRDARDER